MACIYQRDSFFVHKVTLTIHVHKLTIHTHEPWVSNIDEMICEKTQISQKILFHSIQNRFQPPYFILVVNLKLVLLIICFEYFNLSLEFSSCLISIAYMFEKNDFFPSKVFQFWPMRLGGNHMFEFF